MKKIILATFALAALFSCAKQPELPDPVTGARRVQIGANLPKETKVVFTEDGRNLKSTWKAGDEVSVIYHNGTEYVNEKFTLKSGAGTASGTFECATSSLPDGENFRICYPYYPAGDNTWTMLLGSQQGTLAGMGDLIPLSGTASSLSASPVLSPIVTFLRLKEGLQLLTDDTATNAPVSFTVTGDALYATATYNGSALTGNKAPITLNGALTMSNGVLNQDVYVILHLTQTGLNNPSLDLRLHRGNDIYNWTITRTGDDKEMENGHMYTLSPSDANILSKLAPQKIKTAEPAPLKTLYVATDGNDSNAGTSIGAPLRTLQRAFDLADAGTHIYLRGGVYNQTAWLLKKGTKDAPIVITHYENEDAIIDGTDVSLQGYGTDRALIGVLGPGDDLPHYEGADWVTIRELTIRNSDMIGIGIECTSSHVTVEGCDIINCKGPGVAVGFLGKESEDICVRNNFVQNCAQTSREAISFRKVNGFQIYGNTLRNVQKESIDAKSGSRNGVIHHNNVFDAGHVGIYVDAGYKVEDSELTFNAKQPVPTTRNILVYSNKIVYETQGGTGIAIASESGNDAHDIYVYNNLVYNVSGSAPGSPTASACGIKVADNSDYGIVTGLLKDVYIYNNTVYNMPQQGIYVQFPNIENIVIRNNIAALNQAGDIQVNPKEDHLARKSSMEAQVTIQNNMFFNANSRTTHPGDPYYNVLMKDKDKVFVNYGESTWPNIDLRLPDGGTAINKGTFLTAPSTDFAGNARPSGGAVDIGAYEYIE